MGDGNVRPPQNPHPLINQRKFGRPTGNYVGDPYGCAKFGANPPMGGFWANGWNIRKILYLFLGTHLHVREARRRIFTLDGLNDADSRKGCAFWGFRWYCSDFGSEIPPPKKNSILGAWIGVFKLNGQNIESFISSKLLHRFQPNFA